MLYVKQEAASFRNPLFKARLELRPFVPQPFTTAESTHTMTLQPWHP
jgi:hypothetical protein